MEAWRPYYFTATLAVDGCTGCYIWYSEEEPGWDFGNSVTRLPIDQFK